MRRVRVSDLKPGMVFSEPVYIDSSNLLVPKGIPIRQKDIDNLRGWRIREVRTAGVVVSGEQANRHEAVRSQEEVKKELAPVLPGNAGEQIPPVKKYLQLTGELREVFERIRKQAALNALSTDRILEEVFVLANESSREILLHILSYHNQNADLAESAINVTFLSILLGIQLEYSAEKLVELATAALLHDSGMLLLPEGLLAKRGNLHEAEMQKIRQHALNSSAIIVRDLKYPEEVGTIALQHHERWDGEGYPQGLKGTAIHLSARIIAVIDAFEAMLRKRPYRNSMIGYIVIKTLLSDNSRRFDTDVLRVFIKMIGIYPIGSIVLLNDSRVGEVMEVHSEAPLRPVVRILGGVSGSTVYAESIDLRDESSVFIVKAVNPNELTGSGNA